MEILNQFGVQPILLAAQVVNFLILLFILKKFLYKPILKVLETRKKTIEQSLKNAEEIERRLNEITEKEAEALIRSAREGQKIIREAGEEYKQIIEDAKKEYERIVNKAFEDAKNITSLEQARLEQHLKENLGGIVALALEKVTGKSFNTKERRTMIEKEIKNLS